jgi:hypothetical protein
MSSRKPVNLRSLAAWLLASTALTLPAMAVEPSGQAVRVSTTATALGEGGTRTLRAPGNIFQGDVITTNRSGEAQIKFLDDTRFVVGPGSKVTIDEFVFNPNGTAASVGLAAAKGTFRFIGGSSNDGAYAIRTPTATIGIRGTAIDFAVLLSGVTVILWQEGSGWICVVPPGSPVPERTDCTDVEVGDLYIAPNGGGLVPVSAGERINIMKTTLAYAASQDSLDPQFQLTAAGSVPPGGGTGRPPPAPGPRFEKQHEGGPYK